MPIIMETFPIDGNLTNETLFRDSENSTLLPEVCDVKFHKAETPSLFLVGIIVNIVSISMLFRISRGGRSRTSWLTIMLAGNDLFSCTMFLSSSVINTITCDHFKDHFMCDVFGLFAFTSFMWSLNIVVLLSVERYMLIKTPFFHMRQWSLVILIVICVVGLVIDFTLGILPLAGVGYPYLYYNDNRFCCINLVIKDVDFPEVMVAQKVVIVLIAINGIFRALTVAFCNLSVSLVMRRRSTKVLGTWNATQAKAMENAMKYARLTQVIAVTDVLLTVPFCVRLLIDTANEKDNVDNIEDTITSFLVFGTPLINPILYVASNKACRRCLWSILTCQKIAESTPATSSDSRRTSESATSVHSGRRPSEPTRRVSEPKRLGSESNTALIPPKPRPVKSTTVNCDTDGKIPKNTKIPASVQTTHL